jgi:hypothetical protein
MSNKKDLVERILATVSEFYLDRYHIIAQDNVPQLKGLYFLT